MHSHSYCGLTTLEFGILFLLKGLINANSIGSLLRSAHPIILTYKSWRKLLIYKMRLIMEN